MTDEVTRLLRDSFYVTVGFGVLGFQKLQVRRRQLERRVGPVVDGTAGRVGRLLHPGDRAGGGPAEERTDRIRA